MRTASPLLDAVMDVQDSVVRVWDVAKDSRDPVELSDAIQLVRLASAMRTICRRMDRQSRVSLAERHGEADPGLFGPAFANGGGAA